MSLLTTIWGLIALASVFWVIYDALTQNPRLSNVMKAVWIIVALLFGMLGAIAYYFLGRK